MLEELVLLCYALKICEDLFLARVFPSPIRILSEGVAIKLRPDIATAAGVLVVIPVKRSEHYPMKSQTVLHTMCLPDQHFSPR